LDDHDRQQLGIGEKKEKPKIIPGDVMRHLPRNERARQFLIRLTMFAKQTAKDQSIDR
jgi:hypothetical protein